MAPVTTLERLSFGEGGGPPESGSLGPHPSPCYKPSHRTDGICKPVRLRDQRAPAYLKGARNGS